MATHDVDNGLGGLDGSLVYELGREEVCFTFIFFIPLTFRSSLELWSRLYSDLKRFSNLSQQANLSYAAFSFPRFSDPLDPA